MLIRIGYELAYRFPQDTAMILMLHTHFSRASDMVVADQMRIDPAVPARPYRDSFGNWCTRLLAPAGRITISSNGVVADDGLPDPVVKDAEQHPVNDLPEEALMFLLGSRYCEVDRKMNSTCLEPVWRALNRAGRVFKPSAITSTSTLRSAITTHARPRTRAQAFT